MTNDVAAVPRPADLPAARLSPKVRWLLHEHGIDASRVQGTGDRGRITPNDVARTARGADTTHPDNRSDQRSGTVLASPLARRLLRAAGLSPADVATSGPVTKRLAERTIEQGRTATPGSGSDRATAVREVDLTRLLYGVGSIRDEVRRRTGVALTPLAPLIVACCRALRRNPGFHSPVSGDDPGHRDVDLGIVAPGDRTPVATVLPCAQDLTVTGIAARATGGVEEADGPTSSFVVVGDGWGPAPSPPPEMVPPGTAVLTVEAATQRTVEGVDEFGGSTTSTRWVATVHLTRDGHRLDGPEATRFLDDLTRGLEATDLLAAVL